MHRLSSIYSITSLSSPIPHSCLRLKQLASWPPLP